MHKNRIRLYLSCFNKPIRKKQNTFHAQNQSRKALQHHSNFRIAERTASCDMLMLNAIVLLLESILFGPELLSSSFFSLIKILFVENSFIYTRFIIYLVISFYVNEASVKSLSASRHFNRYATQY
jgi:hypothetical protein